MSSIQELPEPKYTVARDGTADYNLVIMAHNDGATFDLYAAGAANCAGLAKPLHPTLPVPPSHHTHHTHPCMHIAIPGWVVAVQAAFACTAPNRPSSFSCLSFCLPPLVQDTIAQKQDVVLLPL